ncbi:hypothetical protein [Actinacidiphila acididurans]|uniref:Uncharacterized protein n=1 Tax=Actinacidiphila acididurans TaxID=2784346 RepID=A0ABS2U527_9ACTN|nr:hypothetical protein [Actinacidiphila acididurans]MBM9510715.1 hypothetical protein [Actinacidiphila acididurans]
MAGTTTTLKYEAYLQSDEGDYVTDATFDAQANPADIWAYLDAVKVRYQQKYPTLTFTGHVQRYDQVVTEIAHP